MADLSGLSAVGPAFMQQQNELTQRAQQITAAQAKLDEDARKLAAQGAMFQGLAQQQGPQPPAPGQPSQSSQPQRPPMTPPSGGPSPNGPQMGPTPPQGGQPGPSGPPGGGLPMAGGQAPPGPPGAGGPPGTPPPGGGPGMGPSPTGPAPNEAQTILQGMAKQLKAANPDMDAETLAEALSQQVTLLKGVQPEVKDQITELSNSLRFQASMSKIQQDAQNAIMKAQSGEEIANIRADTARQIADIAAGWHERGQDMTSGDKAAGRAVTERGQDMAHGDRQDRMALTKSGQDMRTAQNQFMNKFKGLSEQIKSIQGKQKLNQGANMGSGKADPADQAKIDALTQQLTTLTDGFSTDSGMSKPEITKMLKGGKPTAADPMTEVGPASPAPAGAPIQVKSQADIDNAPPGSTLIIDGQTYTK